MKHYVILSNWAPYVGTDYCEYLGAYESEKDALSEAEDYAWDRWESECEEDDEWEDEGPDVVVEVYDPEKHDMLRAGGGSFQDEIDRAR